MIPGSNSEKVAMAKAVQSVSTLNRSQSFEWVSLAYREILDLAAAERLTRQQAAARLWYLDLDH